MLAMQYSFTLPADYDMSIIQRRVAEKGHALDNHAPLILKAYLCARKDDPATHSRENLYAPFYLWRDNRGMSDFLCSAGFKGLVSAFGWPVVRTWPAVVALEKAASNTGASFATREMRTIRPFTPLEQLKEEENVWARGSYENGAMLALSAFEPTTWSLVRFRLWQSLSDINDEAEQAYQVLHVSHPEAERIGQEE